MAGRDRQGQAVDRRRPGNIAEADVVEADFAAGNVQWLGAGHVADRRLDVEHFEDPLRGGEALLQRGIQIGEALQRLVGEQQRRDEREQSAGGAGAADDLVTAVENDDGDRRPAEGLHHRRGARARPRAAIDQREEALDQPGGAALLVLFHAVGLDMPGALKGLAQQGRELADLGLGIGGHPANAPADRDDRADRQREDEERNEGEKPILIEHHADQENDRHRVLADACEDICRGTAQQRRVAGEARNQGAARMSVKIGEIGPHQPGKERDLHIGDDTLADPGHQHGLAVIGEPLDEGEGERAAGDQQQQRPLARDKDAVEHRLHQPGAPGGAAGREPHQQKREQDAPHMRAHEIARQAPNEGRRASPHSHDRRVYSHGFPGTVRAGHRCWQARRVGFGQLRGHG